jgi:hypothetical protein
MATITIQIEDQPNALPKLTVYEQTTGDTVSAARTVAALAVMAVDRYVSNRSDDERLDYPPAPQR